MVPWLTFQGASVPDRIARPEPRGGNEAARVHYATRRRGSHVAARGARSAVDDAGDRVPEQRFRRSI